MNRQFRKPPRRSLALALGSALALTSTVYALSPQPHQAPLPDPSVVAQAPQPGSYADLIEQLKPAVVNIATEGTRGGPQPGGQPFQFPEGSPFGDMFEHFFRQGPRAAPQRVASQGSGFIISADGLVVTNHHVIDGADHIEVTLVDGKRYPATLKGSDPKTDLALLEIDADERFPWVRFGDSDAARVGDWVLAIGNPFGLGGTVTSGIISARGRDIQAGPFDDFIQVDAAINRGNSGGPLFNTRGEVIGINTAIFSPNGGNVGIGFAIPTELASNVIDQLRDSGTVARAWLGVQIQPLNDDIAASLGLDSSAGALVADVVDDSPAARAGIEVGDVILRFGDENVTRVKDLPRLVAEASTDHKQRLELWRDGQRKTLKLRLAASPESRQVASTEAKPDTRLGLQLAELTPELRQRLRLPADAEGAVIAGVEPNSPAARKGLRRGQLITRVGQQPVDSAADAAQRIKAELANGRKSVLLMIRGARGEHFIAVAPV